MSRPKKKCIQLNVRTKNRAVLKKLTFWRETSFKTQGFIVAEHFLGSPKFHFKILCLQEITLHAPLPPGVCGPVAGHQQEMPHLQSGH